MVVTLINLFPLQMFDSWSKKPTEGIFSFSYSHISLILPCNHKDIQKLDLACMINEGRIIISK